jgi:hypothetical protein
MLLKLKIKTVIWLPWLVNFVSSSILRMRLFLVLETNMIPSSGMKRIGITCVRCLNKSCRSFPSKSVVPSVPTELEIIATKKARVKDKKDSTVDAHRIKSWREGRIAETSLLHFQPRLLQRDSRSPSEE